MDWGNDKPKISSMSNWISNFNMYVSLYGSMLSSLYVDQLRFVYDFWIHSIYFFSRFTVTRGEDDVIKEWDRSGHPNTDEGILVNCLLLFWVRTKYRPRGIIRPWWVFTFRRRDGEKRPCRDFLTPFLLEGSTVLNSVTWTDT